MEQEEFKKSSSRRLLVGICMLKYTWGRYKQFLNSQNNLDS